MNLNTRKIVYAIVCAISLIAFLTGLSLPYTEATYQMGLIKGYLKDIDFSIGGIFLNNFRASLVIILGGFLFSLPGILSLGFNLFILGAAGLVVGTEYGELYFLAAVSPHGILELPAILISVVLGLEITAFFIRFLNDKDRIRLQASVYELFQKRFLIVAVFILSAAFVEATITPVLMRQFFPIESVRP